MEEDVEFSDVLLGANLLLPPHRHERAQIVVVLEANVLLNNGDAS